MMATYTMTIQEMMNSPIMRVFPEHYPFYCQDEQTKKEFEEKFIQKFYYREIGFETPYVFNQRLYSLFLTRMPYYEQLYKTEWMRVGKDMMNSKDLIETTTHTLNEESTTSDHSTSSQTNTATSTGTNTQSGTQEGTSSTTNTSEQTTTNDLTSIVDQDTTVSNTSSSEQDHQQSNLVDGVASVSLDNGYLTSVSKDTASGTSTDTTTNDTTTTNTGTVAVESSSTDKGTTSQTISSSTELTQSDNSENQMNSSQMGKGNRGLTETTTFHSHGDIGIQTPAYAITEWRKVIINLDEMILNECESLFLKIY